MAIFPQFYNDAVVAIGEITGNGSKKWVATGFVAARKNENGGYNTFLVTNRHVLDSGKKKLLLRFNISGQLTAKDYFAELIGDDGDKKFSTHPNPKVDVAAILLNGELLNTDLGLISAFLLDVNTIDRKTMLENDIFEGSLVYSLGFPSGLVGVETKTPLCRMGCISRIKEPYQDSGFLLDIQNFPGSSGSPVINRLEFNCLNGTKSYNHTRLIGIMSAYIPYEDVLISKQTGENMQINRENSGIAIAYDVDAIKETVEVEFERVRELEKCVSPNEDSPVIEE